MSLEAWYIFMGIAYPLVITGLIVDRYFLMEKRLVDSMYGQMKEQGQCLICKRPLVIKEN